LIKVAMMMMPFFVGYKSVDHKIFSRQFCVLYHTDLIFEHDRKKTRQSQQIKSVGVMRDNVI